MIQNDKLLTRIYYSETFCQKTQKFSKIIEGKNKDSL